MILSCCRLVCQIWHAALPRRVFDACVDCVMVLYVPPRISQTCCCEDLVIVVLLTRQRACQLIT